MQSVQEQFKTRSTKSANRPHFDLEAFEVRQLLSAATTVALPDLIITPDKTGSTVQGYTPAQIKAAYGFSGLSTDGTGQTIAIVDAFNDPTIAADLATFDAQFGLAKANLQVVSQTGGSVKKLQADSGWASEISLDVEWAHAIAPGAKILLVETNSDSESDLMAGVKYARSASGVSVISMSWGESEYKGETAYDSYFTTPSGHNGVTFVSASGDEGSAYGPEYPSSSPNVLSVGGTTLDLSSTGSITSETGWRDSTGGSSRYETAPKYQSGVTGSTTRTTPDVSYDADPNTGVAVYDSYTGGGGWSTVGGTSAGAPQWSALVAIADQHRVSAGLGTLDGTSQTLPTLYSLYASPTSASYSSYTADFNDISSGGGSQRGGFGGGFGRGRFFSGAAVGGAASGYDTVTGLGTPKAAAVIQALTGAASTASTKKASTTAVATTKSSAVSRSNQTATTESTTSTTSAINIDATPFSLGYSTVGTYLVNATSTSERAGAAFAASSSLAGSNLGGSAVSSRALSGTGAAPMADGVLHRLSSALLGDVVQAVGLPGRDASVTLMDVATGADVGTNAVGFLKAAVVIGKMHFPHFDPAVMFDDVMNAFVNESTALAIGVGGTDARTWAWAVTATVIGIDVALLGRWVMRNRSANDRRRTQRGIFELSPMES